MVNIPTATAEELDEATERVYRGRWPEHPCREYGHFDCAFVENGRCSSEQIDQELQRIMAAR